MPRPTLDEHFGTALARSKDLETWLRFHEQLIAKYVAFEGGFDTTMTVIKRQKIRHRGRTPSRKTLEEVWLRIQEDPRPLPADDEVAPGVRSINRQLPVNQPTPASTAARPRPILDAIARAPPAASDAASSDRALALRRSRHPQMPEIVRRNASPDKQQE